LYVAKVDVSDTHKGRIIKQKVTVTNDEVVDRISKCCKPASMD